MTATPTPPLSTPGSSAPASSAPTSSAPASPTGRITRADIEAKLRQIQGDVETGVESGRDVGKLAAIGGAVL